MAVIYAGDDFLYLDHEEALNKWLRVGSEYRVKPALFDIRTPFLMDAQAAKLARMFDGSGETSLPGYPDDFEPGRPPVRRDSSNFGEVGSTYLKVKRAVRAIRAKLGLLNVDVSPEDLVSNNAPAIEASWKILQSACAGTLAESSMDGENSTDSWKVDDGFLLPPKTRFFNGDWTVLRGAASETKFDLVVMDPPWRNKFVARVKRNRRSYDTFDNDELLRVTGKDFMAPGCLLALWCPSSKSQAEWIQSVLLPAWGCEVAGIWYWFKVTKSGEPIKPWKAGMDCNSKKPFELLILARRQGGDQSVFPSIPKFMMLISVPSAVHSHKPPLTEVLAPYVRQDAECVEVFARGLTPGWTAVGNQVLLFQSLESGLFEVNKISPPEKESPSFMGGDAGVPESG